MKIILKIIALAGLWGVLLYVVINVEPELIRDVGITGIYLPLMVIVGIVIATTLGALTHRLIIGIWAALMMVLIMLLMILRILTWWNLIATLLLFGFLIYKARLPRKKVDSL